MGLDREQEGGDGGGVGREDLDGGLDDPSVLLETPREKTRPSNVAALSVLADGGPQAVSEGVDGAVEAAKGSLQAGGRQAVGLAKGRLAPAAAEAQTVLGAGLAAAGRLEAAFFDSLRAGVWAAAEHREAAAAVGAGAFCLALPGPRAFLYGLTLGRFRSVEGVLGGAQRAFTSLAQGKEMQVKESEKLFARAREAREEFLRGKKKLEDARAQMYSLGDRLASTERGLAGVLGEVRGLPSGKAASVELKAAAAKEKQAVGRLRAEVSGEVSRIMNTLG